MSGEPQELIEGLAASMRKLARLFALAMILIVLMLGLVAGLMLLPEHKEARSAAGATGTEDTRPAAKLYTERLGR